jgi:thiol:disulfide interchange protein
MFWISGVFRRCVLFRWPVKSGLWCMLWGLVMACVISAGPVTVNWGIQEWTSATHVRIPLKISVCSNWKIYGPVLKDTDVGQPTTLTWDQSTNIWHVDAHWPDYDFTRVINNVSELGDWSQEEVDSRMQSLITVNLDVSLKERSPACIKMVVRGLACSKVCQPFDIALPDLNLTPPAMTWFDWWFMLGCAFLGGLILNIMPCVLPVLALKLKGLTQQGPDMFRSICLVTTGGIITGFWGLAALTILVKTVFQQQVGWGMHLQNPYFVACMIIIMMLGGFGLLGLFHVNTPQWAGALLAPAQRRSAYTQAFLSGLVAVLLATPCSAPFLGTALGFALTGQGIEIIVFYTAIALGFALPYVLGLIFPIHKILPRPGQWMVTFEKILGFCLMLSAGWFVATSLAGLLGLPWDKVALGLWTVWLVLPFVAGIRVISSSPKMYKAVVYAIPGIFSILLLILPALPGPIEHPISMQDGSVWWQAFSSETLESGLMQGKTVVVDITGMGCALCMVNKSVFKHQGVQERLQRPNVLCLRGDFTRGDPALMMFLRKYGRSAIPFNMVINAKHPKGVVLSERLTREELLGAMAFVENPTETPSVK